MDFLTPEQVKIEAEKGEIPSIECSLKHHQQGRAAPKLELINAIKDGRFGVTDYLCACCKHKQNENGVCEDCPLCQLPIRKHKNHCCDGIWRDVADAFETFSADYSNANFSKFQTAEGKLCTFIEGVLERKKAEEKESGKNCPDCNHWHRKNMPCQECMGGSNFQPKPKESKPALRHGDYGCYKDGGFWLVLIRKDELGVFGKESGSGRHPKEDWPDITTKIGNIFDDLALRAEDIEKFEMKDFDGSGSSKLTTKILYDNRVEISIAFSDSTGIAIFKPAQFESLCQKFNQVRATNKRKQKSK